MNLPEPRSTGKKLLRLVEYDVNRAYGGSVRTRQIQEILARLGNPLVDHNIYTLGSVSRWRNYARGMEAWIKYRPPVRLKPRNLWLLGSRAIGYTNFLEQQQDAGICLWETTFDPVGPRLAKQNGLPVVALPHNLECFVPWRTEQYPQGDVTRHLARDLEAYGRCDAIFTISREEQWLLNMFGCRAEYLPYFPPHARAAWLQEIRQHRLNSLKTICLVLGSASYQPTYEGMAELVKALIRLGRASDKYVFAGQGTERLAGLGASENFQFLGGVSDEQLRELLITARTALVYQNANPGALTRIPELILAGVPVLANEAACRSWHDLEGLCRFTVFSELESLLSQQLPIPPIPARPAAAEDQFLATVRRLLKTDHSS